MENNIAEWQSLKLGDLGKVSMCKRVLKKDTTENGDIPFYKIGTFGKKPDAFISNNLYQSYKSKYSYPKLGDILISASGTIGRLVIYNGDPAYFQDSNIIWIANQEEKVVNKYLKYLYKKVKWQTDSGTIARLYNDNLRGIKIIAPLIQEQNRIVSVLETWDDAIDKLEQKIEIKKQIKKGLMQQLLTGKKRLPGFDDEWGVKQLGELSEFYNGYAFKSSDYNEKGKYNIITIANVQSGCLNMENLNKITFIPEKVGKEQRLEIGDVLISMTGNVGRVCLVNEPNCLLNQRVGKIKGKNIDDDFLIQSLGSNNFTQRMVFLAQGGAQDNLSLKDIKKYKLNIPKSAKEQKAIAEVLTSADSEINALEKKLKSWQDQKKYLLNNLVTGQIRTPENMPEYLSEPQNN